MRLERSRGGKLPPTEWELYMEGGIACYMFCSWYVKGLVVCVGGGGGGGGREGMSTENESLTC